MAKNYLKIAKSIIEQERLAKYIQILLDYWKDQPTTLGQGFSHVLQVAVESYELGVANKYHRPKDLFVGGLFHDIVRPAEDKGGNEDQTAGAKVVQNLFLENSIDNDISEMVVNAILSHDNWIGAESPPSFDLIVSTADKVAHNVTMAYGYVWASNRFCKQNNKDVIFKNHLQTLYVFQKYQQRAWNLFMRHPITGTDRAIKSYITIYNATAQNYLGDPEGSSFYSFLDDIAERIRQAEKSYLAEFIANQDTINSIMREFY